MSTAFQSADRLVLSLAKYDIPEVPLVGRYIYARAHPPLRQHLHQDAFEVCLLRSGAQSYRIGEARHELVAGDLIVTRPGEAHGTGSEPENRGCLYWIQFANPSRKRPFLGLSPATAHALVDPLRNLPHPLYHNCDLLFGTFERILAPRSPSLPTELAKASLQNLLLRLLLDTLSLTTREVQHACSAGVQRALRHLARHYAEAVTLGGLAYAAGVSESYLKAHFRREVGMTPMEHLMWQRVEHAKRALRDAPTPITELAFQLGFATSQHFATVFKRLTGLTPRDYRHRSADASKADEHPIAGTGAAFHPVASPEQVSKHDRQR
jgi:AraC-like DNA-binding protein